MSLKQRSGFYSVVCAVILFNFFIGIVSYRLGGKPQLYNFLELPSFAPTAGLLVLLWGSVYTLSGITLSASLFCGKRSIAAILYLLLSALTFAWYPLFFGAGLVFLSLFVSATIVSVSLFLTQAYFRQSLLIGILHLPCVAWYSYLFVLEFAIIRMNLV